MLWGWKGVCYKIPFPEVLWNTERWEREVENKWGMEKNWDCGWGGFRILTPWYREKKVYVVAHFWNICTFMQVFIRARSCWKKGNCLCLSLSLFLPSQLIAKWPWIYRSYRRAAEGIFTRFPACMAWPNCVQVGLLLALCLRQELPPGKNKPWTHRTWLLL